MNVKAINLLNKEDKGNKKIVWCLLYLRPQKLMLEVHWTFYYTYVDYL